MSRGGLVISPAEEDLRRHHYALLGCSAAIAFASDVVGPLFQFPTLNLSLAYLFLIVLLAQGRPKRILLRAAVGLIVLTYLGYVVKIRMEGGKTWTDLGTYRLFNRSLVALGIAAVAVWSRFLARLREQRERLGPVQSEVGGTEDEFARLFRTFECLRWGLLSGAMGLGILLSDLVTPAPWNLPILYMVPVLVCALARNRLLLWTAAALSLLCAGLGFWAGPQPATDTFSRNLLLNRSLACGVIVGVTGVLHWRLASRSERTAGRSASQPARQA